MEFFHENTSTINITHMNSYCLCQRIEIQNINGVETEHPPDFGAPDRNRVTLFVDILISVTPNLLHNISISSYCSVLGLQKI